VPTSQIRDELAVLRQMLTQIEGLVLLYYCLSNAMYFSMVKIVSSALDRSSSNLEHSFPLTPQKMFLGSLGNGCGQDYVTKLLILHPLIISAYHKCRAFTFYTNVGLRSTIKLYTGWPLIGHGQGNVSKFVILHPHNYFCSC